MNRNDIMKLMTFNQYPCISIILPTHRTAPDNKQDPIRLKNLIKESEKRLLLEFSQKEVKDLIDKINSIVEEIDHSYTLDGLAIFVNKNFSAKYDLVFPVKEQVGIDETFATRNLIYAINRSPKYWLLVLSKKSTRLFEGIRDQLSEIKNDFFPAYFQNTTWDEPTSVGDLTNVTAYKEEKDKQFSRQIDRAFKALNNEEQMPLVITGVQRLLSVFNEVTENSQHTIAQFEGAYDKATTHELSKLVWPPVLDAIERNKINFLNELAKAVGVNRYSSGIQQCWRMAAEGRVQTLLVEKDYHYPAALSGDALTLYPAESADTPGVIDDAVDELIEKVIKKNGKAVFVQNDLLSIHQRIGAILRY